MVKYAETARRDGVLALEKVAKENPDPFLRRGLQLTIDGTDPEMIERIMRIEIDAMVERHKHGKEFFGTLAKFGPGFGLMATLIAQVAMFRNLGGDAAAHRPGTRRRPDRHPVRLPAAEPGRRPDRREAQGPQCRGGVQQGGHPPGRAQHPGREQPPASSRCSCSASSASASSRTWPRPLEASWELGVENWEFRREPHLRFRPLLLNSKLPTLNSKLTMDPTYLIEQIVASAHDVRRALKGRDLAERFERGAAAGPGRAGRAGDGRPPRAGRVPGRRADGRLPRRPAGGRVPARGRAEGARWPARHG